MSETHQVCNRQALRDAFSSWARGPQGAHALDLIKSGDVSHNEAWLVLRAAWDAALKAASETVNPDPTPEQFADFCERLWDTDESDPVLQLSHARLRDIYRTAIWVANTTAGASELQSQRDGQ